jgi:hypothetical protein
LPWNHVIEFPGAGQVPVRNCADREAALEMIQGQTACLSWDMHSMVFNLENDEHRRNYDRLATAVASNRQHLWMRDFPAEFFGREDWKMLVRWGEKYVQPVSRFMAFDSGDPLSSALEKPKVVTSPNVPNDQLLTLHPELKNRVILFPGIGDVPMRNFSGMEQAMEMIRIKRTVITWDMHARVFDLSNPTQHMAYDLLHSVARSNPAHVWITDPTIECLGLDAINRQHPTVDCAAAKRALMGEFGNDNWKILVRWGERYVEPLGPIPIHRLGNPLGA